MKLLNSSVPLLLAACCFMVLPAAFVQAAQNTSQDSEKPVKKKAQKHKNADNRPAKVTFLPNSQETTGERNARLKRECKGRVNAGACAGFTQ